MGVFCIVVSVHPGSGPDGAHAPTAPTDPTAQACVPSPPFRSVPSALSVDTPARRGDDRCWNGHTGAGCQGAGERGSGALRVGTAPAVHAARHLAAAVRAPLLRLRPRAPPARSSLRARRPTRRLSRPRTARTGRPRPRLGGAHALGPDPPRLLGHAVGRARAPGLDGRHPRRARPPGRGHPPLSGHGHDRRRPGRGREWLAARARHGVVLGVDDVAVAPAPPAVRRDGRGRRAGRAGPGSGGPTSTVRRRPRPPRRRAAVALPPRRRTRTSP